MAFQLSAHGDRVMTSPWMQRPIVHDNLIGSLTSGGQRSAVQWRGGINDIAIAHTTFKGADKGIVSISPLVPAKNLAPRDGHWPPAAAILRRRQQFRPLFGLPVSPPAYADRDRMD
jgi:hypothetical protein